MPPTTTSRPHRAPRDCPLWRPPGAYQPSHWFVPDAEGLCYLCGRGASVYTHMRFTPKTMSDDEYVAFMERERKPVMGMLDQNLGKPFSESFEEGQVFNLEDAKMGPTIPTIHGEGAPVLLKIDGEWYSVFGTGLTNQVAGMDDEDRKRMKAGKFACKMVRRQTKSGQAVKLLAGPDEPDTGDIPF